jgi:hypothetical protein
LNYLLSRFDCIFIFNFSDEDVGNEEPGNSAAVEEGDIVDKLSNATTNVVDKMGSMVGKLGGNFTRLGSRNWF